MMFWLKKQRMWVKEHLLIMLSIPILGIEKKLIWVRKEEGRQALLERMLPTNRNWKITMGQNMASYLVIHRMAGTND